MIYLGRILGGVVLGIGGVIVPIFVREITPVEVYGLIGGVDKI